MKSPNKQPQSPAKSDFTEQFLIKYANTLFNGDFQLNPHYDQRLFEENSLKQGFKLHLNAFIEGMESQGLCSDCLKALQTQENRFFNFRTENLIKKLKESCFELKNFRENLFKMLEKFVAADIKLTNTVEIGSNDRLSLLHLEILKGNIEESNKYIVELKEDILFLVIFTIFLINFRYFS